MKKLRQKDIAKKAGVSPSAVSAVLKNPDTTRVSDETRERIYSVMDKYRYPRRPVRNLTDIVCVYPKSIMENSWADFFYGSLLLAIEQTGQHFNRTIRLRSYSNFKELFPLLVDPGVAGIISINSSQLADEPTCQKPIIAVNSVYTSACDVVQSNQHASARDQVSLLHRYGHQRIAFFAIIYPPTPETAPTEQQEIYAERFSGYCEGLFQNNLPILSEFFCIEHQDARTENPVISAQQALTRLLQLPSPPTAILAFNDSQAASMVQAANKIGIRIPQDISIIGNDNVEEGRSCIPALTTAEQNRAALGKVAVEKLVQRLDSHYQGPFQLINIPLKMIERDSVTAPSSRPKPHGN